MTHKTIPCKRCHGPFIPRFSRQVFCNPNCSRIWWHEQKPKREKMFGLCSGTVGAIAEIKAAIFFMEHGWDTFRALSPASFADLIIMKRQEKEGRALPIEVRTGYRNIDGTVQFPSKPEESGKIFAVVVHEQDSVHLFRSDKTAIDIANLWAEVYDMKICSP